MYSFIASSFSLSVVGSIAMGNSFERLILGKSRQRNIEDDSSDEATLRGSYVYIEV